MMTGINGPEHCFSHNSTASSDFSYQIYSMSNYNLSNWYQVVWFVIFVIRCAFRWQTVIITIGSHSSTFDTYIQMDKGFALSTCLPNEYSWAGVHISIVTYTDVQLFVVIWPDRSTTMFWYVQKDIDFSFVKFWKSMYKH